MCRRFGRRGTTPATRHAELPKGVQIGAHFAANGAWLLEIDAGQKNAGSTWLAWSLPTPRKPPVLMKTTTILNIMLQLGLGLRTARRMAQQPRHDLWAKMSRAGDVVSPLVM